MIISVAINLNSICAIVSNIEISEIINTSMPGYNQTINQ